MAWLGYEWMTKVFFGLMLVPAVLAVPEVTPNASKQKFTVVPDSVEVNAGDDVFLKCVVQNQQGKTQWTKDGFALGFERDVPGYPRYSYSGDSSKGEHHLVINGATLEDDGEYQCQVGPTATTSPLWAAANVTVMVSPSSITVIGGGDKGKVEAVAGQSLHLQCVVRDARPAPSVAWYRNGVMLDQDIHTERLEPSSESRRWSVRSRLIVVPEAEDDGQQFSCRALHPSLMNSPTSLVASVILSVLHPPEPPVISGYSTGQVLLEGDTITLSCECSGGNPLPSLAWYRDGRPIEALKNASEVALENGRTRTTLIVEVTPTDDRAIYECHATNDFLRRPLSANVTLTVHYSPERVVVTGPSVVAAGQEFTLTCVTSKSNPSASINWLVHGAQFATDSSLSSEADDGGWVTSSDLRYHLDRSMMSAEVTVECKAHNSASDRVVSETRKISVIKPPGRPLLQVEGIGDVVAGGRLVVICSSDGGNPHPSVTIYKGNEQLQTEVVLDVRVTRARAVTEVMAADNGAKVTCEVNNAATERPLMAQTTIDLLFPPWEVSAWVTPNNVAAGQVVKLICESSSSLPPSKITWRSGTVVYHGASSNHSQGLYGGQVTRSELEVRALIEDNGRLFTCEADNGLGSSVITNVTLNVLHEPVWIVVPTGTVEVREKDDLLLRAVADANPTPITYSWWRGPLMIDGVKSEEGRAEGRLEMKRIHRQEAGGYSVTAASPRGTVNATFVINVLYGPETMMAPERVTVDEDGQTSVVCSAIGNPAPNITWFKKEENGSEPQVLYWGTSEARLLIDHVTRSDTGFYKCLASNIVETASPISTAVVVTQAPESAEEDDRKDNLINRPWAKMGGTGRLSCVVKAAPAPNFRWTIYEDRVLFNSRKYFIRRPQLLDGLVEWSSVLEIRSVTEKDYTTYTCTTTNSRGTYTSNHTLGPPIPPVPPMNLNVTTYIGSTAIFSWIPPTRGTLPRGYGLRYRRVGEEKYEHVEVHGRETTMVKIQGLSPGASYEFSIQTFNDQGRSSYTSQSLQVTLPGVVEEVASSSSQPRVPRLTLLLMSLTGAALLVLNISIIICFVRRFLFHRGTPAPSYKTTVSETYTPASTPGLTNDDDDQSEGLETSSSAPQYQITRQSSISKDDGRSSVLTIHHLATDAVDSPKHKKPLAPSISSDLVNVNSPNKSGKNALMNGVISVCSNASPVPRTEITASEDILQQNTEWNPDNSHQLDDNISRRMKATVQPSDIPDVCPKSLGSMTSLTRHPNQEIGGPEDDRISLVSHQSNTSYVNLHEQVHGMGRLTPISAHHQETMTPPIALMNSKQQSNILSMTSCQDSSTRSSISDKSQSQEGPPPPTSPSHCCTNRPASQVIYHGQPHIQKQHEQRQFQEHIQNLDHHQVADQQLLEHHPGLDQQHLEHSKHSEHCEHLEYHQMKHHEAPNVTVQYCESKEKRDFHRQAPCCHQPSVPPSIQEPQGHHEHQHHHHHHHQQHQHPQQSPSHHQHYSEHRHHHQPIKYLQQQSGHSLGHSNPAYNYPSSNYHMTVHHPSHPYLQQKDDLVGNQPIIQIVSERPKAALSPVPHGQREYQYQVPFTEPEYRSYPQHPPEQVPLQCIREEPSTDLGQYLGLDAESLFVAEDGYSNRCMHQESSLDWNGSQKEQTDYRPT